MKNLIGLLFFNLLVVVVFCQKNNSSSSYFQQEVNYDIDVTLDDANNELVGISIIEYINHSPDALEKIYFHLWANAYQSQNTAYAKQQIQNGNLHFFFADEKDKGGYKSVDFLVNGESVTWDYDEENPDIALLKLNEKIPAGSSIKIRIPFIIKIPKYFSRMGREKQAYYISQWYPKPAVYDAKGWHPMPYLDMGEFYSEFGKFDVKITLPKNYYVAATGKLETKSEIKFLEKRVRETNKFYAKKYPRGADTSIPLSLPDTFPPSDSELKTIRYTAENVHDFAWFADKRFYIQKNRVEVSKNNKVDTWAFFNLKEFHLWRDATKYLNQSVLFYSQQVGEYPYPHATAVSNPFASAGAMEYPMITLVDRMFDAKTLDVVIAHEVGHNWFYGILGFNERDYPWMDEGINSYYERLYAKKFYTEKDKDFIPKILSPEGRLELEELVNNSMDRLNLNQPISTPIGEMTEMNYGLGVYGRMADGLKNKIPPQKMKTFYEEWKFKHPQPEDFIRHFNLENDEVFQAVLNTTAVVDYEVVSSSKSDSYKLVVKNKGGLAMPFELTTRAGEKIRTIPYEGFVGEKTLEIPIEKNFEIDEFTIDKNRKIPDVNRRNNNIRTSGLFKKSEPFRLKFLGGIENPTRTTLFWLPVLGWNNYDKTMLGVVLHNYEFSPKRFEFVVAPMFGTASKNLVGTGEVKYNLFPEKTPFQRVTLSMNAKRFSYRYNWRNSFYDDYTKLAPQLELVFKKKKMTSSVEHRVALRHVNITLNNGFVNSDNPDVVVRDKKNYYVNEFKYTYENSKVTSPWKVDFTAHQGDGFLRLFSNAKLFIPYRKEGKGARLTAFAGVLPQLDNPSVAASFTWSGITSRLTQRDYMFDELLFGRTQGRGNSEGSDDGIFSQQLFNRDAGFKTLSDVDSSEDWMVSVGVRTTVPGPLPVRPFINAAIYKGRDETPFAYAIGLAIVAIPDAVEIYLPIYENNTITESSIAYTARDTYFKKITFLVDINNLGKKGKEMTRFW